jgi:hypothetical protein
VVEQCPHHLKVKGSSPAAATGPQKWERKEGKRSKFIKNSSSWSSSIVLCAVVNVVVVGVLAQWQNNDFIISKSRV